MPESKPDQVAEGDEIKSDKLNSIRTAAQSLQIVGVRPKPKGLAADLKADKALLENQESMVSLLDQGFVPHEVGGSTEILATAGETILTTREGVRYTLRFGEESVVSAALETGADEKAETPASKRERYLLVTASVDETRFPAPELQPIPQTVEELKKMDEEKAAAEAAKKAAAEAAAQPPTPPAPQPEAGDKPPEPSADAPKTEPETPAASAPTAEESKPEPPKPEEAAAATEPQPEEPKAEEPKPEEPKAEEPKAEEANAEEANAEEASSDELEEETDEGAADDEQDAAEQPPGRSRCTCTCCSATCR